MEINIKMTNREQEMFLNLLGEIDFNIAMECKESLKHARENPGLEKVEGPFTYVDSDGSYSVKIDEKFMVRYLPILSQIASISKGWMNGLIGLLGNVNSLIKEFTPSADSSDKPCEAPDPLAE